jgi:hypothetical protein
VSRRRTREACTAPGATRRSRRWGTRAPPLAGWRVRRARSCAALKILRRSRRTLSSCSRQSTASDSRAPSSVPFTVMGV